MKLKCENCLMELEGYMNFCPKCGQSIIDDKKINKNSLKTENFDLIKNEKKETLQNVVSIKSVRKDKKLNNYFKKKSDGIFSKNEIIKITSVILFLIMLLVVSRIDSNQNNLDHLFDSSLINLKKFIEILAIILFIAGLFSLVGFIFYLKFKSDRKCPKCRRDWVWIKISSFDDPRTTFHRPEYNSYGKDIGGTWEVGLRTSEYRCRNCYHSVTKKESYKKLYYWDKFFRQ